MSAQPHYLYRCYDARGRLLYIGCTSNPRRRMQSHKASTAVASVLLSAYMFGWEVAADVYPTRDAGLEAEAEAIAAERPLFNQQQSRAPMWLHMWRIYAYIEETEPLQGDRDSGRLAKFLARVERMFTCDDGPLTPRERKELSLARLAGWSA